MARPIVLSNGSLHVGINNYGLVHDFFYPYVGLENHAAANRMRHKIGIWVDGDFSWLDDNSWQIAQTYAPGSLTGVTTAHSNRLEVSLQFHDLVDSEYDAFLRTVEVFNRASKPRVIRVFMHQVYRISNSLTGDTAQYLPGEAAILHYKGHRAFVIGAEDNHGQTFDQYAVGVFGIEGKDGVFRDAEDGELSGNAVEHGSVDSVIRSHLDIAAHDSARVNYWVACGKTQKAAIMLHRQIVKDGIAHRRDVTEQSWQYWLEKSAAVRSHLPKEHSGQFTKSLLLVKSHIDNRGGVIASTDTTMLNYSRDAYAYCWPRDGAFALWPLLRIGYRDELQRFFEFCCRGLSSDGFLYHKYQADGAIGSSWHPYVYAGKPEPPIQEDETAVVLFMAGQYYQQTRDAFFLTHYYPKLIKPMANFLADYIEHATKLPHASYDLWEEKFLTSTYTTAVVFGALEAAVQMAEAYSDKSSAVAWQAVAEDIRVAAQETLYNKERKFFYKGFRRKHDGLEFDETIDVSSFYGAFMFGLFPLHSEEMKASYETLRERFRLTDETEKVTPLPRYENDRYNAIDPHDGNPWHVTTLWLAQYYFETGQDARAKAIINWVQERMMPSGVLPEQINPYNQEPLSVAPLTWSQAEFLNALLDMIARPVDAAGESS